jgi:CMP-N,N'-diacetyllegionaminic acid synthase
MKITAIIPARGGSKGIPGKNMALLGGKPLIQYTIEAAQKSEYISDIFLSSDDPEIIKFCESLDVSVPYARPAALSQDDTPMVDAVVHAIDWLKEKDALPEAIVLLQPTSPLRTAADIDGALKLFVDKRADSLISVHKMVEHPYECVRLGDGEWSYLASPDNRATRRQDYQEEFYYINGAIYVVNTEFFIRKKTFIVEGRTVLYFMDPATGVDIDDMSDLKRAESYLTA